MAVYDLDAMTVEKPLRFGERSATGCDYFDYRPGQPNLYLMMRFKHLLAEKHGIENGFQLYRRTIARHRDAALGRYRLVSHHAHSSVKAIAFSEIFPAGEAIVLAPPKVLGIGNHRPLANTTRSFYVSCLENARVFGRSSITEVEGRALADFQGEELARIDDEVEFDSAVFRRDGEDVWMISDAHPALEVDEALSLLGGRTDFFGDWLCDYVTRYVAATMGARLMAMPVLIDANMPPTHRQALDLMLVPGTKVVEVAAFQTVNVKRLWQAPGICYMPFHQKLNEKFKWDYVAGSPERFIAVEDEMLRRVNLALSRDSGPSRVFLARKVFRHRKLVNHLAIEEIAAARGFAISYPEDLDFAAQAKLLRDARFVVGPEGSAFFLSYFLGRGAKVCILNHHETEGLVLYNHDADLKDIDLTIITGPEVGPRRGRSQDMDYEIDPDLFRRFLDQWLDVASCKTP
jgi:Glycosyltransferase 61